MQSILESCLYYGRTMNETILTALNDNGSQRDKITGNTKVKADWLLGYLYIHSDI